MNNLVLEMKKRGLSANRLGLEAKINPSNLCQAIKGKIPFYPSWRRKLAEYFKMSEDKLFPEYRKWVK